MCALLQWDQWLPDDPATVEENTAKQELIDKRNNEAFEAANPEFCKQFREVRTNWL
jgi:hypothetical protein